MTNNNKPKLRVGRDKRLAKYLDVSREKAQNLLRKYDRSSVTWLKPPTPEQIEKQLFKMIARGENIEIE